jgi:3-dehydroquinate synthase
MINKVNLETKENSYQILIGNNILEEYNIYIKNNSYSKKILITDETVFNLYKSTIETALNPDEYIVVPAGEKTKSFKILEQICEEILQKNIDRNSLLIAFGGGVIGDLVGFCASILLRGIDFIQIPTTLLAMVDSSVGGKTAINSNYGKNLIGTFYQPKLVICDINFLKTLSKREFRAGYAEIVKYGLIYDENFFNYLDKNLNSIFDNETKILQEIITKSCQIKASIVGMDEKEQNIRAILNFGHSFAHIFETETNYSNEILHGEAVAIGMLMASHMSVNLNLIDNNLNQIIKKHLEIAGFETNLKNIRKNWDEQNLIKHIFKDKKNHGNELTFILLHKIGLAKIHKKVDLSEFLKVLKKFLD